MEELKENLVQDGGENKQPSKNFFMRLLCGFCVGFGFIVPGVSGSAIAMIFGMYEEMVDSVSNVLKQFKQSFLFLLPIALGVAVSVAVLYFPLMFFLELNCFVVVMLFAGLLIGALKPLLKQADFKNTKKYNYLVFALTFLAVVGIALISYFIKGEGVDLTNPNATNYIMMFICGVLFAISTVVPGISGTALLLAVGYYYPIFNVLIKETVKTTLKFDFVWSNILLLALFGLGVVIGAFVVSKLIKICFSKFENTTYMAISGFAIGSIPAMFICQDWGKAKFNDAYIKLPMEWYTIVLGIVLLVGGFILSYYLMNIKEKKEKLLSQNALGEKADDNTSC